MSARSIGTATISFGLVSIPTKLYTTNETGSEIHFNMLHDADGARLKQQYICTQCNEIVDREHTVKGYEHAKGQYVMFSVDELKALDAVATDTIALARFPNVTVKMKAGAQYAPEPYPYPNMSAQFKRVYEVYGAQRLHWETDITQTLNEGGYKHRIAHFTEELKFLSEDDKDWIMGRSILARLRWA